MAFNPSKLVCRSDSTGISLFSYDTTDRLKEVLAPGYFPDGVQYPYQPGDRITVACWPQERRGYRSRRANPVYVADLHLAHTMDGTWLGLPLNPCFVQNAADDFERDIIQGYITRKTVEDAA